METQPAVQPAYRMTDQIQLCKKIKTLITKGDKAADKAEQFRIAAGLELKRAGCSTQRLFLDLIGDIGVGKSRAYDLIAIADGTKTVAEVRADATGRKQLERARKSVRDVTDNTDEAAEEEEPGAIAQACSPRRRRVFEMPDEDVANPLHVAWDKATAGQRREFVSAQRFALRRLLDTKAVTLEMTAADVTASELVEPAPSDAPAAPVEFDIGDIPEDLRRTPAPAVEDYQPPDFVKAAFAQGGAA